MKCQTCDGHGEVAASMLATDCDIETRRACKGTGETMPTQEEKQKAHAYLRTTDDYLQKASVRYKKFILNAMREAGGWVQFGQLMGNHGYSVMARYRLKYGSLQSLKDMAELIGEKIYGG